MDGKMALHRNAVFRIVQNYGEKSYFLTFSGGQSPQSLVLGSAPDRSRPKTIRLRLPVLLGIRLRRHPKTSDSLRLRFSNP